MTPNIRPSSDLRNHDAEVSRECREARRPTVITVNGRGDTVFLGYEEYSRMQSELELLARSRTLSVTLRRVASPLCQRRSITCASSSRHVKRLQPDA